MANGKTVLVAQSFRSPFDQGEKSLASGRNVRTVLNVVRRPETLRGGVVALVEKGLEGVQDDLHVVGHGSASSISLMIDDVGRELSTASAPVVRGDREDHFLRVRQVPDAAGPEGLAHGERVQGPPQQLDPSIPGHEAASKRV